jgi:predicted enzyme related to lactoylglutathione lyase
MQPGNALNWFEIPVSDFERGKKFYETIFDYQMPVNMRGNVEMGFFLHDFENKKIGGAICKSEMHKPSKEGSLIYLNCQPDLQPVLERVENAGGNIIKPKSKISETQNLGFWALITDSEGNNVALHSMA